MSYDSEKHDPDLTDRARTARGKLTDSGLAELREFITGLERHEGLLLENKYAELTGKLLEPAIARLWLRTNGDWL